MPKVLHLLSSGGIGGIETLCREISKTDHFDNGFAFLSFGGAIYEELRNRGVTVYPLFELGPKFSLKKANKLAKLARGYDVLIVHHEDPFLEWYFCNILKKTSIKGIRYVHSCYGDAFFRYSNPVKDFLNRKIKQKAFDMADRVIYVSNAGERSCHSVFHVERSKERIIYNGISEMVLDLGGEKTPDISATSTRDLKRILFIGRMEAIKGVDLLISACARLIIKYNINLTLVGDGTERHSLEKMIINLGLQDNVQFTGFQTDINKYLKQTDLFVYPSTWQEVFGLSIVEAMAYGIPCIANAVGGIPEIIQDGVNGFLTMESSADGLENAIEKALLMSKAKRQQMCIEARKTAEHFCITRCICELEKEINTLFINCQP